jgi:hypothetical protein
MFENVSLSIDHRDDNLKKIIHSLANIPWAINFSYISVENADLSISREHRDDNL